MKNLHAKVMTLLEDGATLNRYELARRIERLVEDEVEFHKAEHTLGVYDLNLIRSSAINKFTEIDPRQFASNGYGTSEDARMWCHVEAVIGWLRSQKLINFVLKYDRNRK